MKISWKTFEESDEYYFLEVDVQYLERLQLHNDLPFLPDRMKIENVENVAANFQDKTEYVTGITSWISNENYS